jgi:hypothetical protein
VRAAGGPTHILDVVVGDQALGLILFAVVGLLPGLPPVVLAALLEDVQQLALPQRELALGLRVVVVERGADGEENHAGQVRCVRVSTGAEAGGGCHPRARAEQEGNYYRVRIGRQRFIREQRE